VIVLLALFLGVSHLVHRELILDTKHSAHILGLSDRLRVRSQRVGDLAVQFMITQDPVNRERVADELERSAGALQEEFSRLVAQGTVRRAMEGEDGAALRRGVEDLRARMAEQVRIARVISRAEGAEEVRTSGRRMVAVAESLGPGLDELGYELLGRSESELATLALAATLDVVLRVLALLIGAIWIWARVLLPFRRERHNLHQRARHLEGRVAQSAEEAMEQRRLLEQVLERVPHAVVVAGPDGGLLLHNAEAARVFGEPSAGESVEAWSGRQCFLLSDGVTPHPPEDLPLPRALRGEPVDRSELILVDPDTGEDVWILASSRTLEREDGRSLGAVAVFWDTTEDRRVRTALRETEARLRRAVLEAPFPMFILEDSGRILARSRVIQHLTGYSPEEIGTIDEWIACMHPEETRDEARKHAHRLFETRGRVEEGECELRARDGRRLTWSFSSASLGIGPDRRRLLIRMAVDVTAEKRNREMLRAAKEEAEAHSRAKSEFLANMSHELRTPLNAVLGFGQLLEDGVPGELNDIQRRYIDNILSSGRHLLDLINDILDLAKVESGRAELDLATLDVESALDGVVDLMSQAAQAKGIELGVRHDSGLPPIRADEAKLKQILLNLVSNAIKFTPEGGRVTIHAEAVSRAGFLRVRVVDTGVGIDAEDLERIFEKFTRIDVPYVRKQGTGLGLALSRRLIHAHGGTIRAESEGRRRGSAFVVELPLRETGVPVVVSGSEERVRVETVRLLKKHGFDAWCEGDDEAPAPRVAVLLDGADRTDPGVPAVIVGDGEAPEGAGCVRVPDAKSPYKLVSAVEAAARGDRVAAQPVGGRA